MRMTSIGQARAQEPQPMHLSFTSSGKTLRYLPLLPSLFIPSADTGQACAQMPQLTQFR